MGNITDPAAFQVLEDRGLRWSSNESKAGGQNKLNNLIAYSDQSRIHNCLADGVVDAFGVDLPIYYWACENFGSPWFGKIEIVPGNLAQQPYYYTMAVNAWGGRVIGYWQKPMNLSPGSNNNLNADRSRKDGRAQQ